MLAQTAGASHAPPSSAPVAWLAGNCCSHGSMLGWACACVRACVCVRHTAWSQALGVPAGLPDSGRHRQLFVTPCPMLALQAIPPGAPSSMDCAALRAPRACWFQVWMALCLLPPSLARCFRRQGGPPPRKGCAEGRGGGGAEKAQQARVHALWHGTRGAQCKQ